MSNLTIQFLLAATAVLLAGTVSGLTGFGFALISVPPLLLIYEPATVVAMINVMVVATAWFVLADSWRALRIRMVLGLLPWAALGLLGGVILLEALNAAYIGFVASAVVVGFAVFLILDHHPNWVAGPVATIVAGGVSGLLSATSGLAGPPVVLLLSARRLDIQAFRSTATAYFSGLSILGLGLLIQQDIIHRAELLQAGKMTPLAVLGVLFGQRLVRMVDIGLFRRITLTVIMLTGGAGMVFSIAALSRP